jgi:hypothetical protein
MEDLDANKKKARKQRQYQIRALEALKFANSCIVMLQSNNVSLDNKDRRLITTPAILKQRTDGHDRVPDSRLNL